MKTAPLINTYTQPTLQPGLNDGLNTFVSNIFPNLETLDIGFVLEALGALAPFFRCKAFTSDTGNRADGVGRGWVIAELRRLLTTTL
jgi:hypothetical protein